MNRDEPEMKIEKHSRLRPHETALVLIDVQEKLVPVIADNERLLLKLRVLIEGVRILGIPVYWMEQYPQGLGPTVKEIAELLDGVRPFIKRSFSGCGNQAFMERLREGKRRRLLVAGIESHVCVYQTAHDLLREGYSVEVVADATSSRNLEDKRVSLKRIVRLGAELSSVEMALFEMLQTADAPQFKQISRLVR